MYRRMNGKPPASFQEQVKQHDSLNNYVWPFWDTVWSNIVWCWSFQQCALDCTSWYIMNHIIMKVSWHCVCLHLFHLYHSLCESFVFQSHDISAWRVSCQHDVAECLLYRVVCSQFLVISRVCLIVTCLLDRAHTTWTGIWWNCTHTAINIDLPLVFLAAAMVSGVNLHVGKFFLQPVNYLTCMWACCRGDHVLVE